MKMPSTIKTIVGQSGGILASGLLRTKHGPLTEVGGCLADDAGRHVHAALLVWEGPLACGRIEVGKPER